MAGVTVQRALVRITGDGRSNGFDTLVAEEPLEIRIGGEAAAVTMRTPGNDFELAAGFLLTEGVVERGDQITEMRYCVDEEPQQYNILSVTLTGDAPGMAASGFRNFTTTSSCGLCGKASIDDVRRRAPFDVRADTITVSASILQRLPAALRDAQQVFERTGGLHAAGLFTADGELVCLREDIGRHNAFDKVIGWAATHQRVPLAGHVLLASGRASFELVQKALLAGVPVIAAVSAPSSLAVQLAEESGMTLVAFLRDETMNIYAGAERVTG
jgi:FdhD protein